ncbi:hypothetical protein PACTADRAFT_33992 [Pachysolen tannophilus NRRL Y-2460]|uniref:Branched-chain-amino-acid aminotransferase n=1 Tax=Pachysolen tannophilus NRRL Y-2460 TaxID=669874 RepID=A0A1E4TUL0_PACTA|nr:hypothetical protein PACTADRAFT_33992 [Pachysolen tannophilus NRRL Y-2460]
MTLAEIDFSKLKITKKINPTKFNDPNELPLGSISDHMVVIDYDSDFGWHDPEIIPTEDFKLDPAASVLHYAIECFEGMKAYKSKDGKSIRTFRPTENMNRLNNSSTRIALPNFNGEEVIKIMDKWLEIDSKFIPINGHVYVRPNHIGINNCFGLKGPKRSRLYIIAAQSKSALNYDNFTPLKLYSNDSKSHVRAWPGGFGNTKLGANYGPTAVAEATCIEKGFDLTLWLFGENNIVTETGGSNLFISWINDDGIKEVVTCPLSSNLILPGITRKSVIQLLNLKGEKIVEKEFTIDDLIKASKENRLLEAFACGTYFFISPIGLIRPPKGNDIKIPTKINNQWGEISKYLFDNLSEIMWGNTTNHEWCHKIT